MDSANVARESAPRQRSWFARHWWWVIPLLLLLAAGGVAGYAVAPLVQLKTSEPYRMALQEVGKAPEVVQRLGEPLQDPTWLPAGSVYSDGARGDANLSFRVAGPKGIAQVSAQARKIAGQWGLSLLEVTFSDGKRLALNAADAAGSEAPKFNVAGLPTSADAPRWQPGGDAPKWPPAGASPPANAQESAPVWNPPMIPGMDKK